MVDRFVYAWCCWLAFVRAHAPQGCLPCDYDSSMSRPSIEAVREAVETVTLRYLDDAEASPDVRATVLFNLAMKPDSHWEKLADKIGEDFA